VGQEFRAGTEGIGHGRRVLDNVLLAGLVFGQHEPSADRVVGPLAELAPGRVDSGELHGVGVKGQPLTAVQDNVVGGRERDVVRAEQCEAAGVPDLLHGGFGGAGVDQVRRFTGEPEHDRLDAAMAVAGSAE